MKNTITRYDQHFQHIRELDKPLDPQVENGKLAELRNEVADKNQLRGVKGEDFGGLNLEGLQKLEKTLESGLKRVNEIKEKRFKYEIGALKEKGLKLEEENKLLKQKMAMLCKGKTPILGDLDSTMHEVVSSESMNNICSCNSGLSLEDDSSDTSLKLGLPFPN